MPHCEVGGSVFLTLAGPCRLLLGLPSSQLFSRLNKTWSFSPPLQGKCPTLGAFWWTCSSCTMSFLYWVAREAAGRPCSQGMLLAYSQLVPAQTPGSLPTELLPARQELAMSLYQSFLPRSRTWCLSLVNLNWFLPAHSSSLVRSLRQPPGTSLISEFLHILPDSVSTQCLLFLSFLCPFSKHEGCETLVVKTKTKKALGTSLCPLPQNHSPQ